MKTTARWLCALLLTLPLAGSGLAATEGPASFTGEHDLGRLLERAGKRFDLQGLDAVLLVDELREEWTADGRRVRSVHQVAYVRTAMGIRNHADLRVPYDGERQKLEVGALRTWRLSDRRWIDSGETARVETLPFALGDSPDYAGWRETMLLHDGVELPCLMETLYTISDTVPFRAGTEGLRTFSRPDPAMLSRLVLAFPAEAPITFRATSGVAEPVRGSEPGRGLATLTFEAGPLEALPRPESAGGAWRVPHVAWSTWGGWAGLGGDLERGFEGAVVLDDRLKALLAERLKPARSQAEKAALVAGFVAEATRLVRYDTGWWPAPRNAMRTWESSYGTAADRSVLAAALYREAGLSARFALRGASFGDIGAELPTLAWCGGAGLWVRGEAFEGWFDGATASFARGRAPVTGRLFWRPGTGEEPAPWPRRDDGRSLLAVRFDLQLDETGEAWEGSGFITATGALCPYDRMTGLEDEARRYLGRLAASVLDGAKVRDLNPAIFEPGRVVLGFGVRVPLAEPDRWGRVRIEAGAPELLAQLLEPSDLRLHEETRQSVVALPGPLTQRVELHLSTETMGAIHLPTGETLANGAGRLVTSSKTGEGEASLVRELVLSRPDYTAADWSDLRALLLAEARPGNRLILLRPPAEEEGRDR